MEGILDVIVERIGKVEKTAKGTKTDVGSASNGIDHLKRSMEKVDKNNIVRQPRI